MKNVLDFLKNQRLMAIATSDERGPWIANVYFSADEKGTIYFVSSIDTRHSEMILKNQNIAFSTAWFDPNNQRNRKSVQGLGACRPIKNPIEIAAGIKLLYKNFSDLRDIFTVEWIVANMASSRIWKISPTYIKYWDDELYGEDESKEFIIS